MKNKKQDWLNWFKLAVTQSTQHRLAGDIEYAQALDKTIEQYYAEARENNYYTEEYLYEIENDIRNSLPPKPKNIIDEGWREIEDQASLQKSVDKTLDEE